MNEFPPPTPQSCSFCTIKRLRIILFFLFILLIGSIALAIWLPPIIENKLDSGVKQFTLIDQRDQQQNSQNWQYWVNGNPDSPIRYNFYLWNLTNPENILQGEIPQVEQLGPVKFFKNSRQLEPNFVFDAQNRELIYSKEYVSYMFDSSSILSLSDTFTSINFAFQILGGLDGATGNLVNFQKICFSSEMNEFNQQANYTDFTRFFQKISVSELAFGFSPPPLAECAAKLAKSKGIPINPKLLKFPGLMENSTESEVLLRGFDSMFTGRDDPNLMRIFNSWRGNQFLAPEIKGPFDSYPFIWGENLGLPNGAAPNKLRGTRGLQFNPDLGENEKLEVFIEDIQRCVYLAHQSETIYKGITLYHFILDPAMLQNSTLNPSNAPYYQFDFVGIFNETRVFGIPIFASKPNFLDADQRIIESISGIHPNRDDHETFLDVEPISGATFHVHKRLQINLKLEPVVKESWGMKLPSILFVPLSWADEYAEISDSDASKFRSSVYLARDLIYWIPIVGTILSCSFALLILLVHWAILKRFKTNQSGMLNAVFQGDGHVPLLKDSIYSE